MRVDSTFPIGIVYETDPDPPMRRVCREHAGKEPVWCDACALSTTMERMVAHREAEVFPLVVHRDIRPEKLPTARVVTPRPWWRRWGRGERV